MYTTGDEFVISHVVHVINRRETSKSKLKKDFGKLAKTYDWNDPEAIGLGTLTYERFLGMLKRNSIADVSDLLANYKTQPAYLDLEHVDGYTCRRLEGFCDRLRAKGFIYAGDINVDGWALWLFSTRNTTVGQIEMEFLDDYQDHKYRHVVDEENAP
jgi:hypothetical protein